MAPRPSRRERDGAAEAPTPLVQVVDDGWEPTASDHAAPTIGFLAGSRRMPKAGEARHLFRIRRDRSRRRSRRSNTRIRIPANAQSQSFA